MPATEDDNSLTRILVIDDSKVIRKASIKMLSELYDVIVAEDGEDGWTKIVNDSNIQVVFTDLKMPNLDGFGLLERVRTNEDEGIRNLPIIVVTGADDEGESKEKAFELGATDFITKPFNTTDIKARAQAHANYQRKTRVLQQNSQLDSITGLLNLRGFEEQLAKDISFVTRHSQPLAVLVLEMDDFKNLFVKIGRTGADSIIKEISRVLSSSVRKEDTVARAGLSRFIMSLPTAKADGAVNLAKTICSTIAAFKITLKGQPVPITLSVGVATLEQGVQTSAEVVLEKSSTALKNAIADGPGQVKSLLVVENGEPLEKQYVSIDAVLAQAQQEQNEDALRYMDEVLKCLQSRLNDQQLQYLSSHLQ
jgi:two-component system cell cycle response regulator